MKIYLCPRCNFFGDEIKEYCPLCGCRMISECPECGHPIVNPLSYYCTACGFEFRKMTLPSKKARIKRWLN